jgi:hypothetical protein
VGTLFARPTEFLHRKATSVEHELTSQIYPCCSISSSFFLGMDLKLDNKSALVSGSTAGIGFAIAQILVQEGTSVATNRAALRADCGVVCSIV